jgi:hypothetical protein
VIGSPTLTESFSTPGQVDPTFVCQIVLPECPLQSHFVLLKYSIWSPNYRSWSYPFREEEDQASERGALALGYLHEDPHTALGIDSLELSDCVEFSHADN